MHGFASGPSSAKGVAFAEHYARRGITLDRLDLRVPSLPHLRLSAMLTTVQQAIGGADDRAVVIGSSLGGLVAARVAARDPRDRTARRAPASGFFRFEDRRQTLSPFVESDRAAIG